MTPVVDLSRFRRRAVWVATGRRTVVAFAVVTLATEVAWAAGQPLWRVIVPAIIAGMTWAAIASWRSAPSPLEIARRLDTVSALGDLVSTAIDARAAASPLHALVRRDAARAVAIVPAARVFPFAWPQPGRVALALALVVQVGVAARVWTAPERTAARRDTMPGLASAPSDASGAPNAQPSTPAGRPEDIPAPPPELATPGRAEATTRASGEVPPGTSTARAVGTGTPAPATVAGTAGGSRHVPAAYREIVAEYFSALRSARAPARASGKHQP